MKQCPTCKRRIPEFFEMCPKCYRDKVIAETGKPPRSPHFDETVIENKPQES